MPQATGLIEFNPINVDVNIGDIGKAEGFAQDNAVQMQEEVEAATSVTGADGKHQRYATSEQGGTVTLNFLYNSETSLALDREIAKLREPNAKPKVWTISVTDKSTGRKYTCNEGALLMFPLGISYGAGSAADRSYTWDFQEVKIQVDGAKGGTPSPGAPSGPTLDPGGFPIP